VTDSGSSGRAQVGQGSQSTGSTLATGAPHAEGSAPLGLVERLRNGGQPDLADMAEELLDALRLLADIYDAMGAPRGPSRIRADAAIAKACA
jgi:hypothetical protein